jgi:hypothetical protein
MVDPVDPPAATSQPPLWRPSSGCRECFSRLAIAQAGRDDAVGAYANRDVQGAAAGPRVMSLPAEILGEGSIDAARNRQVGRRWRALAGCAVRDWQRTAM